MLCLEFRVILTNEQRILIDKWLGVSRIIYNHGLARLIEWDEYSGFYVKRSDSEIGKAYYSQSCPIPVQLRRLGVDKNGAVSFMKEEIDRYLEHPIPYSLILNERSRWIPKQFDSIKVPTPIERKDSWGWRGGWGYSCPIRQERPEILLQGWELQKSGGLGQVAKMNYWPPMIYSREHKKMIANDVLEMPFKFRMGVLTMLETPWQEYFKGRFESTKSKRGRPKFKTTRDQVTTLIHPNPKGIVIPDLQNPDTLKGVPKLKSIKVLKLHKRWKNPDGSIPPISTFKIIKRDGSYFVQLTGEIQKSYPVKVNQNSVGIDPGLIAEFSLSTGESIPATQRHRKHQKQRSKLQRQLEHKASHGLILWVRYPERTIEDFKEYVVISENTFRAVRLCKTYEEIQSTLGSSKVNRLKYALAERSKTWCKLKQEVSKQEKQLVRSRKADDDKLTSRIIRNFGFIAVEEGTQDPKLRKKPSAKVRADGKGYDKNSASQKSGMAMSLADASPGRKISMLERKAKRSGRVFARVTPGKAIGSQKNSRRLAPSKECPICGSCQDLTLEDRWYSCKCSWECDRDINASVNVELMAFACNPNVELSDLAERAKNLAKFHNTTVDPKISPSWVVNIGQKKWKEILGRE